MAVHVAGDFVDFLGDRVDNLLLGIAIGLPVGGNDPENPLEGVVDHQIRAGNAACSHQVDFIEKLDDALQDGRLEPIDGNLLLEQGEQSLRLSLKPDGNRELKGNYKPRLRTLMLRVETLMQAHRLEQHYVATLQGKVFTLDDVCRSIVEQDIHLIIGVKVLELHIQMAFLIIEDIKDRIIHLIDLDDQGLIEEHVQFFVLHAPILLQNA